MLRLQIVTFLLLPLLPSYSDAWRAPLPCAVKINGTANIDFPAGTTFFRFIANAKSGGEVTHVYKVCNGKNKKTCGFWMNKNTKKKVASGPTNYNKTKKALIIKKIRKTDLGRYESQDGKIVYTVYRLAAGEPGAEDIPKIADCFNYFG